MPSDISDIFREHRPHPYPERYSGIPEIEIFRNAIIHPRQPAYTEMGEPISRTANWRHRKNPPDHLKPNKRLRTAPIVPGRYVYAGYIYVHYGHFLLETLSRLWCLMRNNIGVDGIIVKYRDHRPIPSFVWSVFDFLGIRSQIIVARSYFRVSELLVPEPSIVLHSHFYACQQDVYQHIAKAIGVEKTQASQSKHLYMSRRLCRSSQRTIQNEKDVEQIFAAAGFEVVYPELIPAESLWRKVSTAETIAGPKGSAMHNIVFSLKDNKTTIHICADGQKNPNAYVTDQISGSRMLTIDALQPIIPQHAWDELENKDVADYLGMAMYEANIADICVSLREFGFPIYQTCCLRNAMPSGEVPLNYVAFLNRTGRAVSALNLLRNKGLIYEDRTFFGVEVRIETARALLNIHESLEAERITKEILDTPGLPESLIHDAWFIRLKSLRDTGQHRKLIYEASWCVEINLPEEVLLDVYESAVYLEEWHVAVRVISRCLTYNVLPKVYWDNLCWVLEQFGVLRLAERVTALRADFVRQGMSGVELFEALSNVAGSGEITVLDADCVSDKN